MAPLCDLINGATTAARLVAHGVPESDAPGKARLFADAAQLLIDQGHAGETPAQAFFVPGRVEACSPCMEQSREKEYLYGAI